MDKSKMMMGIIILLLVLLIVAVFGASLWIFRSFRNDTTAEAHNVQRDPETITVLTPADMILVPLGQQTANLYPGPSDRNDNIVVAVEVGLDATGDEAALDDFYAVFNRGIPAARSIVFDVLVARTFDEVRTLEGRAETSEIIKYALQEAFGSNLIVAVYFDEWNVVRGW